MMRWIIIGVAVYILYKLITNGLRNHLAEQDKQASIKTPQNTTPEPTGKMVKDPICGVYVDAIVSVSVRDGAEVTSFCSYECRDAYLDRLRNTGRDIPCTAKTENHKTKEDVKD